MKWRRDPVASNGIGGEVVDDNGNLIAAVSIQVIKPVGPLFIRFIGEALIDQLRTLQRWRP